MSKDVKEDGPWTKYQAEQKEPEPWTQYSEEPKSEGYEIPGIGVVDPSNKFLAGAAGLVAGSALGPGIKSIMASKGLLTPKQYAGAKLGDAIKLKTPTEVAEQAIANRTPSAAKAAAPVGGAVENYGRSQFVDPQGKGLFYGAGETGDYAGARKAAEEAISAEKRFPGMKTIEGGSTPFSVPENVAKQIASEKQAASVLQNAKNQAEINDVAKLRAQRLAQVQQSSGPARELMANFKAAPVKTAISRTGDFLNKAISPSGLSTAGSRALGGLGGLDVGIQGVDAFERASEGQILRSLISGVGAAGGVAAMSRHPIAMPLGIGASLVAPGLNSLLDKMAKENPQLFKKLNMAAGGLVHLSSGGQPQFTPEEIEQFKAYENYIKNSKNVSKETERWQAPKVNNVSPGYYSGMASKKYAPDFVPQFSPNVESLEELNGEKSKAYLSYYKKYPLETGKNAFIKQLTNPVQTIKNAVNGDPLRRDNPKTEQEKQNYLNLMMLQRHNAVKNK